MLTPKLSCFNDVPSLFDTSPPINLNTSLDGFRDLAAALPPLPSTPMPSPDRRYNTNMMNERLDIVSVLTEIGMTKYIPKFIHEEIDVLAFSLLDADDLIEVIWTFNQLNRINYIKIIILKD